MEYFVYFLTLLGLFCAAFFIVAIFSSKALDNVVVLPFDKTKEPNKGDEATILCSKQKIEGLIEEIYYEEDNLTRRFVIRCLR